jgi:hypothetical protein
MEAVRGKLKALGIAAFDAFSSEIMDLIASRQRKLVLYPDPIK